MVITAFKTNQAQRFRNLIHFGSDSAPSQPSLPIAKRQEIAVSQLPHATAATPLSDGGLPSAVVVPKIATTVVSRGDSLWRISRVTYGAGMRYAVVYKANRDQIRNPDRIYPGQIFVLPMKAR
jgi:nucleoid-associated protein YgaU